MMTKTSDYTPISAVAQQRNCLTPEHGTTDKPVRILHVLGGMDRGGVETWLMHVLRHIDWQQFQMHFLVHTDRRCAYDDEIEALGSSIHYCPTPSNPFRYARNFRRILREHGPYDVVHSHVHHFSGFVLLLARVAGVKQRIAHSHTDTRSIESKTALARRLYLRITRKWIHRYASKKVGASPSSADALFGASSQSDLNTSVLYCGIDLSAFHQQADRNQIRSELNIAPSDFVIGHVGRFVAEKNQEFLLAVHAEFLKLKPGARLLLIGNGPLDGHLRTYAERLGIIEHVCFAGIRTDVARLMLCGIDVFVMPSLREGLGLAAVEAQAAGLPTILSDRVPLEADTGCGLVRFVSLTESAATWARLILHHAQHGRTSNIDILSKISRSHFSIERSVASLCQLYTV